MARAALQIRVLQEVGGWLYAAWESGEGDAAYYMGMHEMHGLRSFALQLGTSETRGNRIVDGKAVMETLVGVC